MSNISSIIKTAFVASLLAVYALSCTPKANHNTKIAVTGDNKPFHSKKRATVDNKLLRNTRSVSREKQRQHANFQGHDDAMGQ